MRVLVTGASGFIGSECVRKLVESGHDVVALLRSSSSIDFLKGINFTRITGDLSDESALMSATKNADAVIHLAGMTAAKNRNDFFQFNGHATRALAWAALQNGVKKFIYVSSQAASGPSPGLRPKTEEDQDRPVSSYGESKLRGELYLEELKGQLPYVIVRPPVVYGPRDRNVFLFFKLIQKNWMPVLPAKSPTGQKYINAIHVEDLVQFLVDCLGLPNEDYQAGEKFFIHDGHIYTQKHLMETIARTLHVNPIKVKINPTLLKSLSKGGTWVGKLLKKNLPLNSDKWNELHPDYWICSAEKAFHKVRFTPKYNLDSGIPQTIAWYKTHDWL